MSDAGTALGTRPEPETPAGAPVLRIEHRQIRCRRRAGGVVWFDFREICGGPRSFFFYV